MTKGEKNHLRRLVKACLVRDLPDEETVKHCELNGFNKATVKKYIKALKE